MIHDKFDALYSKLRKKTKFQSLLRYLIRNINDIVTPVYFSITRSKFRTLPARSKEKIIVSLTSFPGRIDRIWVVVECLLRQTLLPDKIILYLAQSQFENRLDDLPKSLLKYYDHNVLEIVFVDQDLRSHKKYFYALQSFPDDLVITVDDDIYYPSNLVNDLVELHHRYPQSICCLRAYNVAKSKGNILPYKSWTKQHGFCEPSFNLFHTSGGGTLYKNAFFIDELFNQDVFVKHCFLADDVWLNLIAQISRTTTAKGSYFSNLLPVQTRSIKLSQSNVAGDGNDSQIRSVIDYYKILDDEIFI